MSIASAIALFSVMVVLAAIPSSSVLLVVTRSVTLDIKNGIATSLGVVAGDLIFVALAILGMTALAEQFGGLFVVIKYAAAAYLIWFGISLLRSLGSGALKPNNQDQKKPKASLVASFGAGLLLTLGDLKAIFFYASLLPAFLELSSLSTADVMIVALITVVAVGGVKIIYAIAAERVANAGIGRTFSNPIKAVSGSLLIGAGVLLALKNS